MYKYFIIQYTIHNYHNCITTPPYLGTTYWINDYLHVGHVHYDIALIQGKNDGYDVMLVMIIVVLT